MFCPLPREFFLPQLQRPALGRILIFCTKNFKKSFSFKILEKIFSFGFLGKKNFFGIFKEKTKEIFCSNFFTFLGKKIFNFFSVQNIIFS
jgi:hypothetical protein